MCGHAHDIVIYFKFHRNPFTGFGAPGGRKLPFPITLPTGFYNSMYCATVKGVTSRVQLINVFSVAQYRLSGTIVCVWSTRWRVR